MKNGDGNEDNENFYGVLQNRNIDLVQVGDLEYKTWYGNSLYFGSDCKTLGYKYSRLDNKLKKIVKKPPTNIWLDKLYVCEYCFKYTDESEPMSKHRMYCRYAKKQPGKIKYKDDNYTIRKIKGSRHEMFCQSLCLFAKLFLETKSIFFSVENFDFYVVYGEVDENEEMALSQSLEPNKGSQSITRKQVPMGYFSKEVLQCWDENNLGCICVFPPYQNRQLGTLLISFSYELSRFQGLISGPEHPLSTFGRVSYIKFWCKQLTYEFTEGKFRNASIVTIDTVSRYTGFRQEDVVAALEHMDALVWRTPEHNNNGNNNDNVSTDNHGQLMVSRAKIEQWRDRTPGYSRPPVLNRSKMALH